MHKYKLHIRRNIAAERERARGHTRARARACARDLIFNLIKNNEGRERERERKGGLPLLYS